MTEITTAHYDRGNVCLLQTQEREAKENMKKRARELQQARRDAAKRGGKPPTGGYGGFGSASMAGRDIGSVIDTSTISEPSKPVSAYSAPR